MTSERNASQPSPTKFGQSSRPSTSIGAGVWEKLRNYGSALLLALLILLFSVFTSTFMTLDNIQNVLIQQAIGAMMAFAVMFPLILNEFDLSVGNMIGFLMVLGATLAGSGQGAAVIIPVMIVTGVLVGFINGVLTVKAGISSFIATLGVGITMSGLSQGLSGGQVLFTNIPSQVVAIGNNYLGPLSVADWIAIVVALALFYLLELTPIGRAWYATGGSEKVAFLAGLRTRALRIGAFTMAGLFVGIGSVIALGQSGGANPGYGPDLLLPAYAAAFLGVTTFRPGRYNVIGTVVGLLLLAVGFNGLSLLGVPFWVQPIYNGGVLLLAVALARSEARKVRVG